MLYENIILFNITDSTYFKDSCRIDYKNAFLDSNYFYIKEDTLNYVDFYFYGQPLAKTAYIKVNNIEENQFQTNLIIYPNPATTELKFNNVYKVESCKIMNIMGQEEMLRFTQHDKSPLEGGKGDVASTGSSTTIDISHLSKGVYIIELTTKEGFLRNKFIKE
jgi:hypothetical protein